jgi:GNAT superfamily N-acetyltransferase
MQAFSVNLMTQADLPSADELRRLEGWNQRPQDWARLLALEPQGCFVAKAGADVIGSVTTTIYARELAWIGMMLVHPQHRRQGIGKALMRRALEYLTSQGVTCVKLDATPTGLALYKQLGFVSEWTLTRWQITGNCRVLPIGNEPRRTRALTHVDWPFIERLDSRVLGVSRLPLLQHLNEDSLSSRVWPVEGPIAGWGMLRPGAQANYLGPVVGLSLEAAYELVRDLLAGQSGASVFWDVPDQNETGRHLAQELGFQPVRPLTRMRSSADSSLGSPHAQLGIADPALG